MTSVSQLDVVILKYSKQVPAYLYYEYPKHVSFFYVKYHYLKPLTLKDGIKSLRSMLPDEIFVLGILLLEPCISLIYAWKTNKYTNYSFSLLIMYGSYCMFRHYIAIFREGY